jgi:hypothetical protein
VYHNILRPIEECGSVGGSFAPVAAKQKIVRWFPRSATKRVTKMTIISPKSFSGRGKFFHPRQRGVLKKERGEGKRKGCDPEMSRTTGQRCRETRDRRPEDVRLGTGTVERMSLCHPLSIESIYINNGSIGFGGLQQ